MWNLCEGEIQENNVLKKMHQKSCRMMFDHPKGEKDWVKAETT